MRLQFRDKISDAHDSAVKTHIASFVGSHFYAERQGDDLIVMQESFEAGAEMVVAAFHGEAFIAEHEADSLHICLISDDAGLPQVTVRTGDMALVTSEQSMPERLRGYAAALRDHYGAQR